MKITILTYGSQGDVEPFVALSRGFLHAGHSVRLAAPKAYQSRFDLRDIAFIELPGEPARLVRGLSDQAGMSRVQMVHAVSQFVVPLANQVIKQSRMACSDADVIIHSFLLTSTGIGLSKELEIPNISAQLFPIFHDTSEFPAPTFPDLPLGGAYRRLTHKLVSSTFKWGSRILYGWLRSKNPQIPRLTEWVPDVKNNRHIPILYGFSPHVVPKPKDWKSNAHITGYWLLPTQEEQHPAKELIDFIRSGSPPITIAFGSTVTPRLGEIIQKVTDALSICKQRGVIVAERTNFAHPSPDLFQTDYIPYSWLFKRSAAVIHHGGAGTTAKGLMAGVPNIILPFTSDQPFWGQRVHSLGTGPKPISPRRLSTKAITNAINTALKDQNMRSQAKVIGRRINNEEGVLQAVNIVENYLMH